uniref:Latrophilin 1 n=1 Tax=Rhipicephalus appendiculatus TaxID=34631 RepID=A0A131YIX1_RHIAP
MATCRRFLCAAVFLLITQATVAVLTVSLPNYSIRPPQLGRERIRYTTEYTCEGRELNISCPENYQIHLVRANYGRLSIGICNDFGRLDWSVNCMSYKSFLIMQDRCAHKSSCGTHVSSSLFGDPCPGTLKYLEMQYHCVLATASPTPSGGAKEHPRPPLHGPAVTNTTSHPQQLGPRDRPTASPNLNVPNIHRSKQDGYAPVATSKRPAPSTTAPTTTTSTTTTTTTTTSTPAPTTSRPTSTTAASPMRPGVGGEDDDDLRAVPDMRDFNRNRYPTPDSRPPWHEFTPFATGHPGGAVTDDPSFDATPGGGGAEEYCAPTTSRELSWNWTRAGNTAVQKCPGGATGVAKWKCSRVGLRWVPDKPDLRLCRSLWVENLRERLESGESIISVAIDLSLMTQTKWLFSQDVKHIAAIVQQMLSKAVSSMETFLDAWHREQVFKELLDAISETASNLLELKQRPAWQDLSSADQKQVLTMLMAALEESALLLAESFSSESFFPVVKSNILLSVKVIDSRWTMNIQFPSVSETQSLQWSGMQDSVLLPVESIAQFSKHGLGKVVFIAYNGVEDFLRPEPMVRQGVDGYISDDGYSEQPNVVFNPGTHVVNSRVVAASVGRHRNSHLPQPITVTLKHLQETNVSNPQCVFWNYDMQTWSTEGCWVHFYNSTHTTCACDHLTNFAVLMEVQPVQAYSTNPRTLKVITTVGCVLASLFLLVTIILLHILSFKKNDRLWIHRNLTLCLLISEFVFIGGISQTHLPVLCGVVAGLLHYFLLVAFAWMFLEGFQIYTVLMEPMDSHRSRLWWFCSLAYIAPAIIVSIAAIIDPYSFGTSSYCWLESQNYFIFSFVGPCVGVVFGCVIFLCISACVLCHQGSTTTAVKCKEEAKLRRVRSDIWWAVFLVTIMSFAWGSGILYVVKYTAMFAYLFCIFNSLQGAYVLFFCCWKNEVVQEEVQRVLKNVPWLPECLRRSSGNDDNPPPHVLSNGTAAQLSVVQQSWNSQDKNSTVTPKFTIPGHQSMDRVSNNRSLALASPDASSRILEQGQNNINALSQVSGGTLHRSSPSNNISGINSPDQQPSHPNKLQRTPSHLKSGQAAQNGPHHRTWAHSRRPGHYSDSSSVYSAFADHIYESIDGDASSVDRLSDVPPPPAPPQSEAFYGDLSDMSQHSSSSYGYDQRPLLVAPLPGKYQATPLAHVMQGFARDYASSSPEMPRYGTDQQRHYGSGRRKHDIVGFNGPPYSPKMLYEVALAQRLEDAPTNFSSDSGMVADSEDCWGTSPTLPDLLHGPVESNPVVMAVLDGEKVVSRIRPDAMMTTPSDPRLQQQQQQPQHPQRYNLSTYC